MLLVEQNARREIYAARKIIYEGDDRTRRTFISLLIVLIALLLLFILSFFGTSDVWDCSIDSVHAKHNYVCKEVRKAINCRTLSGPIKAEVSLNVNNEVTAQASVVCPWEIAISELRVCFVLLSMVCVGVGIYSVRKESKKYGETYYQGAIFFGVVLLISSYFDYLSIQDSKINNYNFCTFQDDFALEMYGNLKAVKNECGFDFYYITVLISFISALLMFWSSLKVRDFKDGISLERV